MMVARMFQAQFNAAVSALDSDGDGRLMSEEWSGSYDTLRGGRDARMFRYLYDADRSGSVTDAEVARFMDAYDSQSPYADADLNGVVDQTDLQYFVTQVSGQ
jgi:predicted metal-dependent peptidase